MCDMSIITKIQNKSYWPIPTKNMTTIPTILPASKCANIILGVNTSINLPLNTRATALYRVTHHLSIIREIK